MLRLEIEAERIEQFKKRVKEEAASVMVMIRDNERNLKSNKDRLSKLENIYSTENIDAYNEMNFRHRGETI